jgi:hypothetical protein
VERTLRQPAVHQPLGVPTPYISQRVQIEIGRSLSSELWKKTARKFAGFYADTFRSRYTRDKAFATNTTLPLLEGLNAWSHCYLQHDAKGDGTLDDWNAAVPDQIFENGPGAVHIIRLCPSPRVRLGCLRSRLSI